MQWIEARKRVVAIKRYVLRLLRKLMKPRMRGESFRKWVGRNIDNSLLAAFIDVVQVILGLVVTIIYFNENWLALNTSTEDGGTETLQLGISVFFTVDYFIRIYASDNRRTFFWSPFSMVDLVTILPQWIEIILDKLNVKTYKSTSSALKTLRSLRFLRAFRLLAFAKTAKRRQSGVLFLTVMAIIVCSAGMIQAIEACGSSTSNCQDMEIYNACYFVVITIATLGYGDIAPKSQNGKLAVIGLIIWTGILLPLQISKLSDVLSRETEYDKSFKERKEKSPHILICGEVNSGALDFFLRQFLHPNNMNWKDKVVILCPSLPSHNLKRILLNGAYEQRVIYLQGSAMLDSDLRRASASTARLCFVMINKLSTDGDQSDTASNLLTISLRHYTKRVPLFVQVLKSDNIRHVHLSGANNIVCIDQLKLGILAKSCLIPGLCAFLCNILFTFRPLYVQSTLWAGEFLEGCCNDVYEIHVPPFLHGFISYKVLAYILFEEFQAVPIALCDNSGFELNLLPVRTPVNKMHTILVLSKHADCVRRIETLSYTLLQKYQNIIPNYSGLARVWSTTDSLKTRLRSMAQRASINRAQSVPSQISKASTLNSSRVGTARRVAPCNPEHEKALSQSNDLDDEPVEVVNDIATSPNMSDIVNSNTTTGPSSVSRQEPLMHAPRLADLPPVALHHDVKSMMGPTLNEIKSDVLEALQTHRSRTEHKSRDLKSVGEFEVPSEFRRRVTQKSFENFVLSPIPHNLSNHIILCGMPNMLHDFVAPLREIRLQHSSSSMPNVLASSNLSNTIPIVIITPITITEKQHASIAAYDQVFYLQASPLHEITLREAQVYQAATIVILGSCTRTSLDDDQEQSLDFIDQNMIDTDAITLHRFITEACENNRTELGVIPKIIIELSRPSSLRFLKDEHTMLDSEEDLKEIRLLTRQVISRADDPLDNICSPLYAAGKVFISNSLDALLGSCNSYGSVIDLFHLLIMGEPPESGQKGRCLDQISVPVKYCDKPYGLCYQEMLLKHDILCVGVYRSRSTNTSFVSMNPSEDILLHAHDKLFVIH
ncbi:Voltage-gated Ion Channel (VIC) Superfamily [Thraustotheca clavata]|uniref:BK channel n=1 Tax=Thraustotheca clavata TaxID=74557 RepID=A0A1V9YV23_9STRA|nr:Voltage-gated Ion Channel (VIC) Superfamily [Thraustotheca clavata]